MTGPDNDTCTVEINMFYFTLKSLEGTNYRIWLQLTIHCLILCTYTCKPKRGRYRDMELPASPSSRQFSTRKPGEPGLAEWAQKIRALQRQVDQDEEEEHRRLEQEIATSRLARVRRGAGYGRASPDPAAGMLYPSSVAGLHED